MDSDIVQQTVIVAVGALFTVAICGALVWWIATERPWSESSPADGPPCDESADGDASR